MSLFFPVKINSVTNLSDARYCAGMGVDMAGFRVYSGNDEELNKIKAIVGWITGVKIVGEFNQITFDLAPKMIAELGLTLVEITYYQGLIIPDALKSITIIKLESDELSIDNLTDILNTYPGVAYYHIQNSSLSNSDWQKLCASFPILYGNPINHIDLNFIMNELKPIAISLSGSEEIAPGLKNFDDLALILENLEEQN